MSMSLAGVTVHVGVVAGSECVIVNVVCVVLFVVDVFML